MLRTRFRLLQRTFVTVGTLLLLFLAEGAPAMAVNPPPAAESDGANSASWAGFETLLDDATAIDSAGEYSVALEDLAGIGRPELWSLPEAGGAPIRLAGTVAAGERIRAFRISPDGERVAYVLATAEGLDQLLVVPIRGGVALRLDDGRPSGVIDRLGYRADSAAVAWTLALAEAADPAAEDAAAPPEIALLTAIFSNGFESGDSSAWSDTTANACAVPTGGPTFHGNAVAASETWTANGSPHIFTTNVQVPVGVTLTIAPCAEVRIRPGFYLQVNGALIARGTPLQRIRVQRDDPAQPYQSIWVRSPGSADIAFADIGGGGAATSNATLVIEGVDVANVNPAKLDHVKITGSAGYGLNLIRKAGLAAGSRDLVISGSGATQPTHPFPLRLVLDAISTVPTGSYTGNASDQIQVDGGTVVQDATFHERGVPYQIGSSGGTAGILEVAGAASLATLTVESGTTLQFYSAGSNYGGLFVGTNAPSAGGRIIAVGTNVSPVVFISSGLAPTAGSWEGVNFSGTIFAGNQLDHVRIDAAGAPGGDQNFGCPPTAFPENRGALKIFGVPGASFLTNSTIANSSMHGVFRAWTGAPIDFMPSNSFENVVGCFEVLPKPDPPANCPVNPECPQ